MCGEKLVSKRPLRCYTVLPDLGREFALEVPFLQGEDAKRKSMASAASQESFSSWELRAPLQGDKKQGPFVNALLEGEFSVSMTKPK